MYFLNTRGRIHSIVNIFVMSALIINVLAVVGGIAFYVFGIQNPMLRESQGYRLVGPMINPGSYGAFTSSALAIQLALLLGKSKTISLSRSLQWTNVVLLSLATIMTFSRSALLGFLVGVVAVCVFYWRQAGVRLVVLACVVTCLMSAILIWSPVGKEIQFRRQMLDSRTIYQRVDINSVAIDLLVSEPRGFVTGVGVGTFLVASERALGIPLVIHNTYLWLLVETGVFVLALGLAVLGAGLGYAVRVARARTREGPIAIGIVGALAGTLMWCMGTEGLYHRHVWFLLALSAACYRCFRSELLETRSRLVSRKVDGVIRPGG